MVPDSAFQFLCICYCDSILIEHLRAASGPRCWNIWPGLCMLIGGFTLVFHITVCDKPAVYKWMMWVPQWSWLSMSSASWKLPMCFVKQGPSFTSEKCSLERRKWETQTFCLGKGSCCITETAWRKIIALLKIPSSSPPQVINEKWKKLFLAELWIKLLLHLLPVFLCCVLPADQH